MSVPRAGHGASWRRWLPPALWALLVLALSTRPEAFFGAAPTTREAKVVHFYLEVLVHLVQFSVFFVLMLRPLRERAWPRAAVLATAFAAVLALSFANESLQALTPTRTFDLWDMAVDAVGGVLGAAATLATGLVTGTHRGIVWHGPRETMAPRRYGPR
jgi:VanZ family protein